MHRWEADGNAFAERTNVVANSRISTFLQVATAATEGTGGKAQGEGRKRGVRGVVRSRRHNGA